MAERKLLDSPVFIISLDVELLWGLAHTESRHASLLVSDSTSGRGSIDFLLGLFENYNIPATWAIVGHLFLDHCQREDGIPHENMPRFKEGWYSCDPCTDIHQSPLYYGKDIVEKIMLSPVGHEIGYHSFSHVIFSECSPEVAIAEVQEGKRLAKGLGITLSSFVFPQNKVGHVDILKREGFKCYRGENLGRRKQGQNPLVGKMNGIVDKIIAPSAEPLWKDGIWEIPSSMYFCDPEMRFSLLPRAKIGINRAIKATRIFHVFLHPWNLLLYESLKRDLENILAFVATKREEGKVQVATMECLASQLNKGGCS